MGSIFDPPIKEMPGKVVVTQIDNPFGNGKAARRVVRSKNTADDAVVIGEMAKHTDIVKASDMTAAMSAFVASVQTLVSKGSAVRISGIGTFYITAQAVQTEGEGGEGTGEAKNAFGISFTPDKRLVAAASNAEAEVVRRSVTQPSIENVQNMDNMQNNCTLTSGKAAEITGHKLRIACGKGPEAEECGIFMVPCDDAGSYKADKSDWVRVKDSDIVKNFMTDVLFRVPKGLAGTYRLGICTKSPLSGSKKDGALLKKARCSISDAIFNVL